MVKGKSICTTQLITKARQLPITAHTQPGVINDTVLDTPDGGEVLPPPRMNMCTFHHSNTIYKYGVACSVPSIVNTSHHSLKTKAELLQQPPPPPPQVATSWCG